MAKAVPEMSPNPTLRYASQCALALLLFELFLSSAHAQNITYTILEFEGREGNAVTDLQNFPVGRADCDAGANLRFRFSGIPTDRNKLDFWRGENCSAVENRQLMNNVRNCEPLGLDIDIIGAQQDVSAPLANLVDCSDAGDAVQGTQNVFVLAANNTPSVETDIAAFGTVPIRVDFVAPNAPQSFSGSDGTSSFGDTSIPLSWDPASNQQDLTGYTVYDAGDCAAPDVDNATEIKTVAPSASSTTLSASSLGLDYGAQTAVFITLTDRAGNESEPSSTVCIERTEVAGFCDVHGECEDCSVHRTGKQPTTLLGLLFALGTLAWRRRK